MGVLLDIAIVVNSLFAMRYDAAIGRQLAELTRERTPNVDFEALHSLGKFELKRSILSELDRPTARLADPAKNGGESPVKGKCAEMEIPSRKSRNSIIRLSK